MAVTFYQGGDSRCALRDFILTAIAQDKIIYSSQDGYCTADAPNEEMEGEWEVLADSDALALCGDWSLERMERDLDTPEGDPYFLYGGNGLNFMWLSLEGEWLTDSDGSTNDPTRWKTVGEAADFIEETARRLA